VSGLIKCLGGEEFSERDSNFLNYVRNIFQRGAKIFPAPPIYGHAYLGANCVPVPTPSSPDKAISVISVKSPLHKGAQTKNVRSPVVFCLYYPSSQSNVPTAHQHFLTLRHCNKGFVGAAMASPSLNRKVERSIHGQSDSPWCSMGKMVRLNCPGKKHISDINMPLIAVAKIIKKAFLGTFHAIF